ncbi:DUF3325 domain-containing protein [Methylosinus sporium]|uniref:DUF3325 domain-containing protein n=1 Tax=Methylosinus sporium TaxID=428 RepID=UPI00383AD902
MNRHHQQVFGRRASKTNKVAARCLSCVLFVSTFISATLARSGSIGVVAFVIAASVGALLATVLLAYAPRFAAAVASFAGLIAILEMILDSA